MEWRDKTHTINMYLITNASVQLILVHICRIYHLEVQFKFISDIACHRHNLAEIIPILYIIQCRPAILFSLSHFLSVCRWVIK